VTVSVYLIDKYISVGSVFLLFESKTDDFKV